LHEVRGDIEVARSRDQWHMSVAHAEAIETIKMHASRMPVKGITLLREELPKAHIDVVGDEWAG